ncbi:MAG: hypothetical protein GY941_21865 [Planctomycetes bacterium]|nr:hypothetical protein [Planctomycetota bacterium]
MRWKAMVRTHGKGLVNPKCPIGRIFNVENVKIFSSAVGFTFNISNDNDSKLIGCKMAQSKSEVLGGGNWDLWQVPESKEEYVQKQKASGIQVEDRVRVVRPFNTDEGGGQFFGISHNSRFVGKVYTVEEIEDRCVVAGGVNWPYFALDVVSDDSVGKGLKGPKGPKGLRDDWQYLIDRYKMDKIKSESEALRPEFFKSESKYGGMKFNKAKERVMHMLLKSLKLYRVVAIVSFTAGWVVPVVRQANPYLVMWVTGHVPQVGSYHDVVAWTMVVGPVVMILTAVWKCRKQIGKVWNAL